MASSRTRIGRKREKKKRKKSRILSIIFLVLIATIAYSVYEYNQGYLRASDSMNKMPNDEIQIDENEKFSGETDKEGKVNILLLGADSTETEGSRTDTIMIAQFNPKTGTAKIASVMRDLYVEIPGYSDNKINAAFSLGGPELMRKTIKENFDIDVQYYAIVNFDGFTQAVDVVAPNGVEIDVEKRMRYVDNAGGLDIRLDPGIQSLQGEELLDYARFRHDSESDFGRVRRQQQVIQAVKEEFLSIKGITKLPRIIGTVDPYIDTNITSKDLILLSKDFLLNPASDIETLRIPVDNGYSLGRSNVGSVIKMDKDMNQEALKEFFSSSTLKNTVKTQQEASNQPKS